jgi:hypothetical protein
MPARRLILAMVATTLAVLPLRAQDFVGRVIDADTEEPLPGVHVVLMDTERRGQGGVFSDDDGRFLLTVPGAGEWRISATRIGYGAIVSDPVPVEAGERVEVEIRLGVEAIPLEALVVQGRSTRRGTDIDRFYDRMERGGFGRFVSLEDIERTHPIHATDLLRMTAGVRVVGASGPGRRPALRMAGGCVPAVFIDGTQINRFDPNDSLDYYLHPSSIEGIEIYRSAGQGPPGYYDPRGCGLVLVWTKRGSEDGKPLTWGRVFAAAGIVLGVLILR